MKQQIKKNCKKKGYKKMFEERKENNDEIANDTHKMATQIQNGGCIKQDSVRLFKLRKIALFFLLHFIMFALFSNAINEPQK